MGKRVAFHTFGCKLNFAETSQLERLFCESGYHVVPFKEIADVYVINTCTVTSVAEKKGRTAIRGAIHRNPDAKVAVIGCFSQLHSKEISEIEGVDIILGNANKHLLLSFLSQANDNRMPGCSAADMMPLNKDEPFAVSYSSGNRTRSFFKIQDGCDYFCTYCAIPFARGRNRSNNIKETVAKAEEIAQKGIKEVILTGVNIGEFGKEHNETFFELIQALDKVEGIERYRISSIEPNLITDDIVRFVAQSKHFLPHFHIPLQSGSDTILQQMKRRYSRSLFADRVRFIKKIMPEACIASDIMTGFPGETDEVFTDITHFITSLPISDLHVFTYSERPNTIALKFDGKIPMHIRRERSNKLIEIGLEKKQAFYLEHQNSFREVLWESTKNKGYMFGFTDNYIKVKTPYNASLVNHTSKIKLDQMGDDGIFSVIFPSEEL